MRRLARKRGTPQNDVLRSLIEESLARIREDERSAQDFDAAFDRLAELASPTFEAEAWG